MIADEVRKEGFEIFKKGQVRRLSSNHFVVKTANSVCWQIVEIKQGKWICDCGTGDEWRVRLCAAQLHRTTSKIQPEPLDESHQVPPLWLTRYRPMWVQIRRTRNSKTISMQRLPEEMLDSPRREHSLGKTSRSVVVGQRGGDAHLQIGGFRV